MRRAGSGDRSVRRCTPLTHTPARTQPRTRKTLARALPPPAPAWVPRSAGVRVGGRREEGAAAVPPTPAGPSTPRARALGCKPRRCRQMCTRKDPDRRTYFSGRGKGEFAATFLLPEAIDFCVGLLPSVRFLRSPFWGAEAGAGGPSSRPHFRFHV